MWNRFDLTRRCLDRLRAQTVPHDVIVVDNGSTDDTPDALRRCYPEVRMIELGANRGFPAACNRGVYEGTGDVVVLLNNDVECPPDFLVRLVAPLRADDSVGSVSSLLLMRDGQHIESFGLAVDPTLAGYPRLRGEPIPRAQATDPILSGPSGAAGAYRRTAWEEVGGLDEGVFAYGEDVDLALRLRTAGWAAAAAGDAVAVHLGSASAVMRSSWQRYQGGFSRGYFLRRYAVLKRRSAARALAIEAIAVTGDAVVYSHDLAASRGRIAGWHAARGLPRHGHPPADAIDNDITFVKSLRLRLGVYSGDAGACT